MNDDRQERSPAEEDDPQPDIYPIHVLQDITGLLTVPELTPEKEAETTARRELNEVVRSMLIVGLSVSTVILIIGLALSVVGHQSLSNHVSELGNLLTRVRSGAPDGFLDLGILVLIVTPVLRVVGSLIEFINKRNWRYAGISALVLSILTVSVIIGAR